MQNTQKLTSKT